MGLGMQYKLKILCLQVYWHDRIIIYIGYFDVQWHNETLKNIFCRPSKAKPAAQINVRTSWGFFAYFLKEISRE